MKAENEEYSVQICSEDAKEALTAFLEARTALVLELSGDRIHSMNLDGSDRKTIVTDCHLPDGIAVDAKAGHIYWTNWVFPI
jgi:sugar lactone lactonase YvrE